MIDIVILSDLKLFNSNKDLLGHGLITEVSNSLNVSDDFDVKLIYSFPNLLSRIYLPLFYLPFIVYCFFLKIGHFFNNRKLLVLLYPSRLRILSLFLGRSCVCLGPDDTSLVLSALSLTDANIRLKYLRHIEKFISDTIESLTPNTSSLFVGKYDVQSYKNRHPSHKAFFLPHPLFSCDLVDIDVLTASIISNYHSTEHLNLLILQCF